MRSSSSPFSNPSGLVDKRLAPMWAQIEAVRENLPQIAHVSYYLESLFNLDRNLTLLADENVDHHILKDIQIFQGANAYETALAEGYVGSVTAWLASLVGPQGDQGIQGVVDTATLNTILADIQTNKTNSTANTIALGDYLVTSVFSTFLAQNTQAFIDLESDILTQVGTTLINYPNVTTVDTRAQAVFDTSINVVNLALDDADTRIIAANVLLVGLRDDVDQNNTNFASFLTQNATDIARVTVLESTSSEHATSIVSIESANTSFAAAQTLLQATSATQTTSILALQTVSTAAANQINILQVANNANNSSIVSLQTVTADQAVFNLALQTQVDNEAASALIVATTVNTIETGLTASLGFSVDAGDNVAFINLFTGAAYGSSVIISASQIQIDGTAIINGSALQGIFPNVERDDMVAAGNAANFFQQEAEPSAAAPNGANWYRPSTHTLYTKISGAWFKLSDVTEYAVAAGITGQGNLALINSATRRAIVGWSTTISGVGFTVSDGDGGLVTINPGDPIYKVNDAYSQKASATILCDGSPVEIEFMALFLKVLPGTTSESPNLKIRARIKRNGTIISNGVVIANLTADTITGATDHRGGTTKVMDLAPGGVPATPVTNTYTIEIATPATQGKSPLGICAIVDDNILPYFKLTTHWAEANVIDVT